MWRKNLISSKLTLEIFYTYDDLKYKQERELFWSKIYRSFMSNIRDDVCSPSVEGNQISLSKNKWRHKKDVITNEVFGNPFSKERGFACISEINHWSLSFSFASFFHRLASGNWQMVFYFLPNSEEALCRYLIFPRNNDHSISTDIPIFSFEVRIIYNLIAIKLVFQSWTSSWQSTIIQIFLS